MYTQFSQGMEARICLLFLHVDVIELHVAKGHYNLVGLNGEIILPRNWETMIEPGMAITMHMWPAHDLPKPSANNPPSGGHHGIPLPPPPPGWRGGHPPLPPGWRGGHPPPPPGA